MIAVKVSLFDNSSRVYSNSLYNDLSSMAKQVNLSNGKTLYDIIWYPKNHGINFANDIINLLEEGWVILKSDKPKYKAFNPENKLSTYTGLCNFIETYKTACLEYPNSSLHVNFEFKSDSVSQLLKTLHENNVIRFTKFNNKAGYTIPYDFRIDRCCSSENISNIGEMMADRIIEIESDMNIQFDSIFCSLFSGVFIGVSASLWLLQKYGRNVNLAISRRSYAQEIGEGSGKEKFISSIHDLKNKTLVGQLGNNVLVFDEMTNTGITIQELINISEFNGVTPKAAMIIADRILQPLQDGSHIRMYGDIPCYSSITHFEIMKWYEENKELWCSLEQPSFENENKFNDDEIKEFVCFLNGEIK